MPSFYGTPSLGSSSGGGSSIPRAAASLHASTVLPGPSADQAVNDDGKTNIDMTNPVNSAADAVLGLLGLAGTVTGGLRDVVGQVGVPGGPNIGGVAKAIAEPTGAVLGAIGSIPVGETFEKDKLGHVVVENGQIKRRSTTLGDLPGDVSKALQAPQKAVEFQFARNVRVNNRNELPGDIQLLLDQGQITLDDAANMLVERNMGYTADPAANLGFGLVLDPMNFVGPVIGKASSLSKGASVAYHAAEDVEKLGLGTRLGAKIHDAATQGMSKAGAAIIDRTTGSATSGLARAVGVGNVNRIRDGLDRLVPGAGAKFEDGISVATANHHLAVIGSEMAKETDAGLALISASKGEEGLNIERRLQTALRLDPRNIEDGVYRIVSERGQLWLNKTGEELAEDAARNLSLVSDVPIEQVRALVGTTATREFALAAREAAFGRSVDELMAAKAVSGGSKAIDVGRLTVIARDTLTSDRAEQLVRDLSAGGAKSPKQWAGAARTQLRIKKIEEQLAEAETVKSRVTRVRNPETGGMAHVVVTGKATAEDIEGLQAQLKKLRDTLAAHPEAAAGEVAAAGRPARDIAREAIAQYPELADVFYGHRAAEVVGKGLIGKTLTPEMLAEIRAGGRAGTFTPEDVVKWLKDNMERFPTPVHEATLGEKAHKLPQALAAWRKKYADVYDLGFEPDAGWIMREAADGKMVPIRPWIGLTSTKAPVNLANPLGRATEALMGGIRQARVINEAEVRFLKYVTSKGLSVAEGRAVFRSILNKADDLDMTPRSLDGQLHSVFADVLGEGRVASLPFNPAYATNYAFEGNLRTIGLTQKVTGRIKTVATNLGNFPVKVAEQIYPGLKFKGNPLFWTQEWVEAPFWLALRGINPWGKMDPELEKLFRQMTSIHGANNLQEAGFTTQVGGAFAGHQVASALDRLIPGAAKNLPKFKEHAYLLQAVHDFPEAFRDAVNKVNPKFWKAMEDAYGKDPRAVAVGFLKERMALAEGQRAAEYELGKLTKFEDEATAVVQEAFLYGMRKVSKEAYKTQYFNPERGWLERTLNHPYLGLYPLSYMWGKVIPEFARFLFYRPFGKKAPLTGYEAVQHVQQAIITQMNDPEFAKGVEQNEGAIYLAQLLLPATPTDIPVNAPAWLRHQVTGKIPRYHASPLPATPGNQINDVMQNIGVLRIGSLLNDAQQSIEADLKSLNSDLDHAAKAYDSTVPLYGIPGR